MSAASLVKYLHLAYFAKPVAHRAVFRAIQKNRAENLVVIGLGDCQLARKMIQLAQQVAGHEDIRFTGIDLFELRSGSSQPCSLKLAHRQLHALRARTKLVPGDPYAALAKTANCLLNTDLVVIRADQVGAELDRAWFYVPRMLHAQSVVLIEQPGRDGQATRFEVLDRAALQQLADRATPVRRAA